MEAGVLRFAASVREHIFLLEPTVVPRFDVPLALAKRLKERKPLDTLQLSYEVRLKLSNRKYLFSADFSPPPIEVVKGWLFRCT